MVRIKVDPSLLRLVSKKILQKAAELNHLTEEVNRINRALGWKTHMSQRVESEALNAYEKGQALARKMEEMSRYLDQTAAAFLEADNQGAASLATLPTSGGALWWMNRILPLGELGTFLDYLPQAAKELFAAILKPIYPLLPASMAIYTSAKLLDAPGWISTIEPATYLGDQEERTDSELSGFGKILEERRNRNKPKEVPIKSQEGLDNQGVKTVFGCVPTSVSMVLEYWHNQDSDNKTLSPQQLLDLNISDGDFTEGDGMRIDKIDDELSSIDYKSKTHQNSSREVLIDELAKGPVVATVRLGMKKTGRSHAVVVTGINENTNTVYINDPEEGTADTCTWDEFAASWGAKHVGPNGKELNFSTNNLLTIHPK